MRQRQTLATSMTDFTLRALKQHSIMAALTDQQDFYDDQNIADVFSVLEELSENNEVPDVVITVRSSYTPFLLNTLIFRGVTALRLIAIG